MNIIDRFLAGQIQPPTVPGALAYMGLSPEEMGTDAEDCAWAMENGSAVHKAS